MKDVSWAGEQLANLELVKPLLGRFLLTLGGGGLSGAERRKNRKGPPDFLLVAFINSWFSTLAVY